MFSKNKMFCTFWALDIAPTLDVLVLLMTTPIVPDLDVSKESVNLRVNTVRFFKQFICKPFRFIESNAIA